MAISLDEMIKAGATLPEIQAELRKQVAVRDEIALKMAQQAKALDEARTKVSTALVEYFRLLGIEIDAETAAEMPKALFADFEKSLDGLKYPKTVKPATFDHEQLANDLKWLRDFIASL